MPLNVCTKSDRWKSQIQPVLKLAFVATEGMGMIKFHYKNEVPQFTSEHFGTDYADHHLVRGVISKRVKETRDKVAMCKADTGEKYTYSQVERFSVRKLRIAMNWVSRANGLVVDL